MPWIHHPLTPAHSTDVVDGAPSGDYPVEFARMRWEIWARFVGGEEARVGMLVVGRLQMMPYAFCC